MSKKTELLYTMNAAYAHAFEAEMPDGATDQMVRDTVTFFNENNGTNYDPHDTWLEWLQWEHRSTQRK